MFRAALGPWAHVPVALVFADLSGFVTFTERFGDEAAAELLALNRLTTRPIVDAWGGRVVSHAGDGMLLAFATATATANAAADAVAAAVDIVGAASDVVAMRAGVHAGRAIAVGPDLVGTAVNVAARVVAAAEPGEVLVTDDVRRAVSADADRSGGLVFLGPRSWRAKGLFEPLSLWRVAVDQARSEATIASATSTAAVVPSSPAMSSTTARAASA